MGAVADIRDNEEAAFDSKYGEGAFRQAFPERFGSVDPLHGNLANLDPTNPNANINRMSLDDPTSLVTLGGYTGSDLTDDLHTNFGVPWEINRDTAADDLSALGESLSGIGGSGGGDPAGELFNMQRPYLEDIYGQAQDIYGRSDGFPGQSEQTQQALQQQWERGLSGSPLVDTAQSSLSNLIGGDYTDPLTRAAAGGFDNPYASRISSAVSGRSPASGIIGSTLSRTNPALQMTETALGGQKASTDYLSSLLNQNLNAPGSQRMAGMPLTDTESASMFRDTAQGGFLNANPYLDATYDTAAQKVTDTFNKSVMPSINSTFSGAGRFGSNAQREAIGGATGKLGESLSGLANQIYGGNYQSERDRMLGATSGLAGVTQAGIGNEFGAADLANRGYFGGLDAKSQAAGQLNTNVGTALGGAGQYGGLFDTGTGRTLQGAGMLDDIYNTRVGQNIQAGDLLSRMHEADAGRTIGAGSTLLGSQLTGINMAPSLANQDWMNIGQMRDVGATQDQFAQDQQQYPWSNLGNYANILYGAPNNQQQQQDTGGGLWGSIGTGLMAGASTGNPWIGAGVGLADLLRQQ